MFFKGCLTSLSLSAGGIKLLASPGFIVGCQVKVSSLFESLFMAMFSDQGNMLLHSGAPPKPQYYICTPRRR